jgi:hypothetical protein
LFRLSVSSSSSWSSLFVVVQSGCGHAERLRFATLRDPFFLYFRGCCYLSASVVARLCQAFSIIKEGRVHLLLVTEDEAAPSGKGTPMDNGPPRVVGVLSTEDVLEEILQEELLDENDLVGETQIYKPKKYGGRRGVGRGGGGGKTPRMVSLA